MDTAKDVMPYVTAAINAYGVGALAKTGELAADTDVARGSRILQRVFGRGDTESKLAIMRVAGSKPDDEPSQTALRLAILEAFQTEPHLATEVAAMLPREVTGDDDGMIITGDRVQPAR
ncbi:hypothetical protein SAMN05444920_12316 [Nonomuraea solani]|uniref:Uncharacterized protein n=1 Tax=Nonomuraea solani TaxID=1144553 RepID=A0A1H6EVM5_9ACTN|nr:hypothetical protein [Nonomuraea solani]SEH01960.1 hypothetical protein SAMN05444920_12316 [Nonomuraea solani]